MEKIDDTIKEIELYNGTSYTEVQMIIDKILKEQQKNTELTDPNLLSEYVAFSLFPNNSGRASRGTYYGPFATFKNDKGEVTESPGKSFITKEAISYWEERIDKTKNNFLKLRYIDIVLDFKFIITGEKPNHELSKLFIEIGINCLEKNLFPDGKGKPILLRMLNIAILYGHINTMNDELAKLIIEYEDKISCDDKPGLWGFSFDYLVDNKNIKLKQTDEDKIINKLEKIINNNTDPYVVENGVDRLAKYYKLKGRKDDLLRVLLVLKNTFNNNEQSNIDGLLKSNYYQNLIKKFGFYQESNNKIKVERDLLINEFQNISKNTTIVFKKIETSFTITDEEMDKILSGYFEDREKVISRISMGLAVNLKDNKELLENLVKENPLLYMFKGAVYDKKGLPISNIGSIEEDYDSHLYKLISDNLQFGNIFLDKIFEKFIGIFKQEELIEKLFKCPLFPSEDKEYLTKIISHYYLGNYIEMNYLIIPYLEKTFRYLCELNGLTTIIYKETGIEQKSLDVLINNDVVKSAFSIRGEDFVIYFRIILTLKTGWNLRNIFAHGLNHNYFFNKKIADRLLHILLCLSLIRFKEIN